VAFIARAPDVNRIRPTIELLAELEPAHPVEVGVLITKARKGTLSARSVGRSWPRPAFPYSTRRSR
jgi:hypothetical protein